MEAFGAFGKAVAVDRPEARSSRPDTFRYFGHNFLLKYRIGKKSASLERFARPDGPAENSRITFRTRKT